MSTYLYVLFWMISFGASIVGAICGIGGGVIIKPVLDAFGVLSVSTISFLSGCTVLAMTCYSVIRGRLGGESLIDMRTGTPLGIGAAIGGIVGKSMFQVLSNLFADKDMVGAVQAACLLVITLGTLIYTVEKDKVKTRRVENLLVCVLIGLVLGVMSSFLGIGGYKDSGAEFPVYYFVFTDHQPAQYPGIPHGAGVFHMAAGFDGSGRNPGGHERPHDQPAD